MEKPINEQIRKKLFQNIYTQQELGYTFDESISNCCNELYTLQNAKDISTRLLYELMIGVTYLDTYKILNYKILKNIQSFDDIELITAFDGFEDFNDLLAEVSGNPEFLNKLMKNCYQFYDRIFPGRVLMTKFLTSRDNRQLLDMVPSHAEDITYFDRKVDINFLRTFYDSVETLSSRDERYAGYDLNHAIDNIRGFIQELYLVDYDNTIKLLKSMIVRDYEWSKYLLSHQCFASEILKLESCVRIEFIEDPELSIQELCDLYLQDNEYLTTLIESIIDIEKGAINIGRKRKITEDDITSYFNTHVSKKIKRKLKN